MIIGKRSAISGQPYTSGSVANGLSFNRPGGEPVFFVPNPVVVDATGRRIEGMTYTLTPSGRRRLDLSYNQMRRRTKIHNYYGVQGGVSPDFDVINSLSYNA